VEFHSDLNVFATSIFLKAAKAVQNIKDVLYNKWFQSNWSLIGENIPQLLTSDKNPQYSIH
jgi:hypothetical protein